MNKDTRFSIHDWQAKQRLLNEQEQLGLELTDEEKDLVDDMMDNMSKRINPTNDVEKSTALFKYIDGWFEVQGGTYEENIKESLNPEVSRMINRFIKGIAKKYSYSEQDAVFAIMAALKQRDFDGINEHHAGDYKPGFLKQTVEKFLDKLKKANETDYNKVEKIMEKYFSAKKANEANMTGTGASFTPGTGAAYATPNAFGDNKRKKKKAYMGFKEI